MAEDIEDQVRTDIATYEELQQHPGYRMLLATWKVREHALKRQIVEQVIRSQDQAFDVCSLQGNLAGFQWAMSTVESLLAGLSQDLEMMVEQRKMEE